jgi:hypothetical protein
MEVLRGTTQFTLVECVPIPDGLEEAGELLEAGGVRTPALLIIEPGDHSIAQYGRADLWVCAVSLELLYCLHPDRRDHASRCPECVVRCDHAVPGEKVDQGEAIVDIVPCPLQVVGDRLVLVRSFPFGQVHRFEQVANVHFDLGGHAPLRSR